MDKTQGLKLYDAYTALLTNTVYGEAGCDIPLLYWIPKLHKCPYKQRYITGTAKCSTESPSKNLPSILTAVKTGFQKYHDTCFSRGGVNQMC